MKLSPEFHDLSACMSGQGGSMSIMSLDPQLLEVLVCPQDKGPLTYIEKDEVLVNERLGIAYPIEDGIPVMLVARSYPWTPNS